MLKIRPAASDDAPAIAEIYSYYAENTVCTFSEFALTEDAVRTQMETIQTNYPYLVAEADGEIAGYAYAKEFRPFSAYRKTVELTIFLRHTIRGKGYGSQLYKALLDAVETAGYHTAIAVVTDPNPESDALQMRFGFEKRGTLKEVGYKFGEFIGAVYWQKIF